MRYLLSVGVGFAAGWVTCFLFGIFGGKTLRYDTEAGIVD